MCGLFEALSANCCVPVFQCRLCASTVRVNFTPTPQDAPGGSALLVTQLDDSIVKSTPESICATSVVAEDRTARRVRDRDRDRLTRVSRFHVLGRDAWIDFRQLFA
jgi:hypothetical protein